jgi:uncharacterized membrane protein
MIFVSLYIREDCPLCKQAKDDLDSIQESIPHHLVIINVDKDQQLRRKYHLDVPVVEIGPYRLSAPFTRQDLQITLQAERDRENHIEQIEKSPALKAVRRNPAWTKADSFSCWIARHYLAVINTFVFVYVGLPFFAPVLMKFGFITQANWIYKGYSLVCHQLAYRSLFIFGEQPFYPRAAAAVVGYLTFNQATGIGEGNMAKDYQNARGFTGNEAVGYKVALCERDVGIYLGILLFGLIYPISHRRIPAVPWYLWIIIGIIPIGLDGFSQLISQPPFNILAYRESTPFLRLLTGGMFGFFTAWFSYPLVEESMEETRRVMEAKWRRLGP